MRTGEVYSFQPASFIGTAKNTVAATIGSLDSFLDVRGFASGEDSLAWILQVIKPYYVSRAAFFTVSDMVILVGMELARGRNIRCVTMSQTD